MGTETAPVRGSGSCPVWMAVVAKPGLGNADSLKKWSVASGQWPEFGDLHPVHRQGVVPTGLIYPALTCRAFLLRRFATGASAASKQRPRRCLQPSLRDLIDPAPFTQR